MHRDDIESLPEGALVLAGNDMGLQALGGALREGAAAGACNTTLSTASARLTATALRYGATLIEEQLFADRAELEAFVAELRALMRDPGDRRLTWKHGLGPALQDESCKLAELRNWLQLQVLPHARHRQAPFVLEPR